MLHVEPITLKQANRLVKAMHRHHRPIQGNRWSIGAFDETGRCVGAVIVGRPVAYKTDQVHVAEVTRLVTDGTPDACSLLYGAAARAAKAMGFWSIQTFILASEPGTSLKAAGWVMDGTSAGGSWSVPSRPREDNPASSGPKVRWKSEFSGNPRIKRKTIRTVRQRQAPRMAP